MTALATLQVRSPSWDGSLVGELPVTSAVAVRAALDAGVRARVESSRHERSQLLFAAAAALEAQRARLTRLISLESGLCLKDTEREVGRAIDVFRFAAIEALRDDGEMFAGDVSPHGRDRRAYTVRLPVQMVAAITPFNHPLNDGDEGRRRRRRGDRRRVPLDGGAALRRRARRPARARAAVRVAGTRRATAGPRVRRPRQGPGAHARDR